MHWLFLISSITSASYQQRRGLTLEMLLCSRKYGLCCRSGNLSHHEEFLSKLQKISLLWSGTASLWGVQPGPKTSMLVLPQPVCGAGSSGLPCDQMMQEVSWDGHRYSSTSHQASTLHCYDLACCETLHTLCWYLMGYYSTPLLKELEPDSKERVWENMIFVRDSPRLSKKLIFKTFCLENLSGQLTILVT